MVHYSLTNRDKLWSENFDTLNIKTHVSNIEFNDYVRQSWPNEIEDVEMIDESNKMINQYDISNEASDI